MHRLHGFCGQFDENIGGLPVGDNHLDALLGHLACDIGLGEHSPAPESAFGVLYVFAQVAVVVYHRYDTRLRILRIAIEAAIHIAQDDERVGIHHRSDESGEFVIVGEHQLRYAHRVVLVDNGNDTVFEHYRHASTLVEVFAAGGETLLHGEHLPHVQVVFTEKIVVETDEFHLPQGGVELSLGHAVEFARHFQLVATAGHSPRGDEYHLVAMLFEPHHLVDNGRHAGHIQLAVVAGEHVAAHLHHHAFLLSDLLRSRGGLFTFAVHIFSAFRCHHTGFAGKAHAGPLHFGEVGAGYFCLSFSRISTRLILPEIVLGSSSTNSITRGYL